MNDLTEHYIAAQMSALSASVTAEPITEGTSTLAAEDSTQQPDSGQTGYPQRD